MHSLPTIAPDLLATATGGDGPDSGTYLRAGDHAPMVCSRVDPRNAKAWMCTPAAGGAEVSMPRAYLYRP
jgi:hypothetical protein